MACYADLYEYGVCGLIYSCNYNFDFMFGLNNQDVYYLEHIIIQGFFVQYFKNQTVFLYAEF